MPSLDEIREQIKGLDGVNKLSEPREIGELPNILWDDEKVERIIEGFYIDKQGILVTTNKRLLFVGKGLFGGLRLQDFEYGKITSIQYNAGLLLGTITIFTAGNKVKIDNTNKEYGKTFSDYVRLKVAGIGEQANAVEASIREEKAEQAFSQAASVNDNLREEQNVSTQAINFYQELKNSVLNMPIDEKPLPKPQESNSRHNMMLISGMVILAFIAYSVGAPSNNTATPAAQPPIKQQQGGAQSNKFVYRILTEEDKSIGSAIRKSVKIVVPLGLTKEALEENLKDAAWTIFKKHNANAVMVFAYREDDTNKSTYSAGRCIMAPDGDWSKATERYPGIPMRTVVDFADSYFGPKKTIAVNSLVELNGVFPGTKTVYDIDLSRKADSWDPDENIIVSIPAGTPATVIEIKKFISSGGETIRYKVNADYKGRQYTGWVHDWQVK